MNPYRSSAEPLVVLRGRRTLRGRLRSWWRRRFVVRGGRWRFRFRRLPCGCRDRKRRQFIDGPGDASPMTWLWQPPPKGCRRCGVSFTPEELDAAGAELGTFRFRDDP